jgi:hypothetical protein
LRAKPEVGQTAHAHVSLLIFTAPQTRARVIEENAGRDSRIQATENNEYKKRTLFPEIGPRLDPQKRNKAIEGDAKHTGFTVRVQSPFKDNADSRANVSWRAEVTSLDGQTIVDGDAPLFRRHGSAYA